MDIEAGPIWNNEHATERCPEAVREWIAGNGDEGDPRWTGHWKTTVPGEMSVCNVVKGPARVTEVVSEDEQGGLVFPAVWNDYPCIARVSGDSDGDVTGLNIAVEIESGDSVEGMVELLSELGVRPWKAEIEYHGNHDVKRTVEYGDSDMSAKRAWNDVVKLHQEGVEDGSLFVMRVMLLENSAYKRRTQGRHTASEPGGVLRMAKGSLDVSILRDIGDAF